MVNPLVTSSLTRVRPLARLLGDLQNIAHFSSLTVGKRPKFSARGLQSEFYRSASTRFKERTVHFSTQKPSNLLFFALPTGKVLPQALHKADIASLLHAFFFKL